jgi:hypothetical protein
MPHIAIHKVSVGDPPPLQDVPVEKIIQVVNSELHLYLIPGGMQTGKSSVTLVASLPEGHKLILETSLEVLRAAVQGLAAMDAVGF